MTEAAGPTSYTPQGRDLITVVLERGSPEEIQPDELYKWREAARKYIGRDADKHPEEARRRVESVWLRGTYLPGWQEFRKMPDLRGLIHGIRQDPVVAHNQDLHTSAGQGDQPVREVAEGAVREGSPDGGEELRILPEADGEPFG